MKILKIFGIVVGIHLFALILIFANPGCSSTTKTTPSPSDTTSKSPPASTAAPSVGSTASTVPSDSGSSAITFNPNAPAAPAPAASGGDRHVPTRPNTPVAGALMAEPVGDVTPASSYTVKSGDNLWTIARKHNITVAQLTSANSLSANASLRPGQKLVIPKQSAAPGSTPAMSTGSTPRSADPLAAAPLAKATSEGVRHIVKSGETLGAIARKYDVRQGELAVANNISDPAKIKPGMELVIPGYQSPGTKSGKATKSTNGKSTTTSAPPASDPFPAQTAPATPPPVPVIRIDDAPAPKQP
jgi:LysM repeat protein